MTSREDKKQIHQNAVSEHRWPAIVATAVTISLYGLLPSDIQPLWLRLPVVALAALLLMSISLAKPGEQKRNSRLHRAASLTLAFLLVAVNVFALGHTIKLLITTNTDNGVEMLVAAAQVWATNLIAFSILMWELDRGGPVRRRQFTRDDLPPADYRFPQDEDDDTIEEVAEQSSRKSDWRPSYIDYFYESAVASMAFSPGAAVPIRPRTKLLLTLQSLLSFVLLALVIAHAVGALGSG